MSKQAEAYKEKGNEEFKKGNFDKAIEFYTYATEMDPRNHVFYTNRALCYDKMQKYDKALRDAEKSLELKGDWEKGHFRRAAALQKLARFQEALDAYDRCLGLNPNDANYKKSYDECKREMFKGMSDSEILKIEGNDFFKRGKIPEAIEKYTKALDKCGNSEKDQKVKMDLYANRAACYVQLYEPTKVRDDCDKALELDPENVKALVRRAQAYESLEKYKLSLADYETALRLGGGSVAQQGVNRVSKALKQL